MKTSARFRLRIALFALLCGSLPGALPTAAADSTIKSRTAVLEGLKFHYLTAGHGPVVILLHGYTQTSHMWRPIIPLISEKLTVIAPETYLQRFYP